MVAWIPAKATIARPEIRQCQPDLYLFRSQLPLGRLSKRCEAVYDGDTLIKWVAEGAPAVHYAVMMHGYLEQHSFHGIRGTVNGVL